MTSRASDDVFFLTSAYICRRVCHMLHDCSSVVLGKVARMGSWEVHQLLSIYHLVIDHSGEWRIYLAVYNMFIDDLDLFQY
jgi:hypothetical protein